MRLRTASADSSHQPNCRTWSLDILFELAKREAIKRQAALPHTLGKELWSLQQNVPHRKTCPMAHALNPSDVVGYPQ